jgi:hypothetical protein
MPRPICDLRHFALVPIGSERLNNRQVAGSTLDLQPNLYKCVLIGAKFGPISCPLNADYLWIPGLAK